MIVIEQTRQFKQLQLTQHYQRQTSQLATYLITSLFIDPYSSQLSLVITPELPVNNTEFVLNWVRKEVCCASCLLGMDFKELQHNFVRWLLSHDIPAGELQ